MPSLSAWLLRFAESIRPHVDFVSRARWRGSANYWESRYRAGGTSGSGSAGQVGGYKAAFLNEFVKTRRIGTVLELGCGDGRQLGLMTYSKYTGLDVSPLAVDRCRALHGTDESKAFGLLPEVRDLSTRAELTLSLDVIYHLVEDEVFELHVDQLFGASDRYVGVFSSNFERVVAAHVRHREFLPEVLRRFPDFKLVESPANPYPLEQFGREGTHASFFVFERQ